LFFFRGIEEDLTGEEKEDFGAICKIKAGSDLTDGSTTCHIGKYKLLPRQVTVGEPPMRIVTVNHVSLCTITEVKKILESSDL
jgi:hypothetical protein